MGAQTQEADGSKSQQAAQDKAQALVASGYKPPPLSFTNDSQGNSTFVLPYPNAPHDGGAQDKANTQAILNQEKGYNKYQAQLANAPSGLDKLALALNLGIATAGLGTIVGPAASEAVGGGALGTVAGGAATGAVGGALDSALAGGNVGKNVGIGLVGGAVGGIGNAAGLGKVASGTLSGATGAELHGGNPIVGGLAGGVGGGIDQGLGGLGAGPFTSGVGAGLASGLLAKYLYNNGHASGSSQPSGPMPSLPGIPQSGFGSFGSSFPPPQPLASSGQPGSFAGVQPRQEAPIAGIDFSHYGQGPEAQFFQPVT